MLKGLRPGVRNELWPRMTPKATFKYVCDLANTPESILIDKKINEEPTVLLTNIGSKSAKIKPLEKN